VQNAPRRDLLAPLSIESLSAFEVFRFAGAEDWDGLTEYLLSAVINLERAGAEIASLTANTPHVVLDPLAERSPLPLVSSIESTRRAIRARGVDSVILLGTEFTMVGDFLAGPLREDGISVAVPSAKEIAYIQDKIAGELQFGVVEEFTRAGLLRIIERLAAEHDAGLVILGCTELPLLLSDSTSPVPTLDTMDPHIEDLVRVAIGEELGYSRWWGRPGGWGCTSGTTRRRMRLPQRSRPARAVPWASPGVGCVRRGLRGLRGLRGATFARASSDFARRSARLHDLLSSGELAQTRANFPRGRCNPLVGVVGELKWFGPRDSAWSTAPMPGQ